MSAFHGLHNYYGFIMLSAHLVALFRLDRGVVIICIVELYLHYIYFGVIGEDFIKKFRIIVEGKAYVLYLSFSLQLLRYLISTAKLIFSVIISVLRVHKVEIEVFDSARFKLTFKCRADILLSLKEMGRELVSKHIAIPWIAGCKAFAQRGLALAVKISLSSVKIVEAVFKKGIYHF